MCLDFPYVFPENFLLQNELISENSFIKIKVTKKIPKVCLINGNIGPTTSGKCSKVPLWLGLVLEKKEFCEVLNPFWFEMKWLEKKISK